ncbi:hypothetical protein D3C77_296510 [compost metagenome]
MVEGGLSITFPRVIGVQRPKAVKLAIQVVRRLLADAERRVVDLGAADQTSTDHIGAQSCDRRTGNQVITHGIARASH